MSRAISRFASQDNAPSSPSLWPEPVKRQSLAARMIRQYPECGPGILAIIKNGLSTSYAYKMMKPKMILYAALISMQIVAVIMLRTLGFQRSGSLLFEVICYTVTAIPLLVVAVLFMKNGRRFQLRTLIFLVTLSAIFVYASIVPILNIRRERDVGIKLVSLNAEIDREFDWAEYYDNLDLNSAHSGASSTAWIPFWLTPFTRDYLRHPADCEIVQINLYSDEQIEIFSERPERFASLRAVAVALDVSESGLSKLAKSLHEIPTLEAVCLYDVKAPKGFYESLQNVRTIWVWSQGKFRGDTFQLEDMKEIASLQNLETLMIQGYGLTDAQTNALTSDTKLRRLLLRDSFITVSPAEIQRLEQCGITMR